MSAPSQDTPNKPGLERLQAMTATGGRSGLLAALDIRLVEIGDGRVVFEAVPGRNHYNPFGLVHGGYTATMLDSACGCAVMSRLSASQSNATLELKVSYHKAITDETGLLRAEGCVVTMGRRIAFVEARLTDADGRLHASATSTLLVFDL